MGKPERKARERIGSSSSYFLRCFGISRKIHSEKPMVETGQEKKKKKTRSRWFWRATKFRLMKGEITPAPIFETEKQNSTVEHETKEVLSQKNTNEEERVINLDPLSFSGYGTCHENVSTTVRGGLLDPSKTVGLGSKPKEAKEKSSRVRKGTRVDPVIGISIMMLTLMIMFVWGRLCAILCTSTCCYFLPSAAAAAAARRKRNAGGNAEGPRDLDFTSEAYKKKVVLEGFLLRKRRVSL